MTIRLRTQPPLAGSIGSAQALISVIGAVMIQPLSGAMARALTAGLITALARALTLAMRGGHPVAWRAPGLTGLALAATVPLLMPAPVRAGMVFDVFFDNAGFVDRSIDGKQYPLQPFVGQGRLSIDNDLPDGDYVVGDMYGSISNLSFSFTIGDQNFRDTDILRYMPGSLQISIYDSGRNFFFSGASRGKLCWFERGSLKVTNSNGYSLCFADSYDQYGQPPPVYNYYWIAPTDDEPYLGAYPYSGTYGGVRVPAPLPAAGALAAFRWSRRLRQRLRGRLSQGHHHGSGGCQR